jgi:hypothetical protein
LTGGETGGRFGLGTGSGGKATKAAAIRRTDQAPAVILISPPQAPGALERSASSIINVRRARFLFLQPTYLLNAF